MVETWYKEDLDKALVEGCGQPDCDEEHTIMALGVRCCYEGPPAEVYYDGKILTIQCCLCGKPMVKVVPAQASEFSTIIE